MITIFKAVDAFLEEFIVRRALADNFCFYQSHYNSLQGACEWARKTLMDHASEKREHLYTWFIFSNAPWDSSRTKQVTYYHICFRLAISVVFLLVQKHCECTNSFFCVKHFFPFWNLQSPILLIGIFTKSDVQSDNSSAFLVLFLLFCWSCDRTSL